MNKFIIKKPKKTVFKQEEQQKNKYETYKFTKEENRFVDKALLHISDKGSVCLNKQLSKDHQLLYLVFGLKGVDPLLDIFFKDPTEEFVNRLQGDFTINDETKELVRKRLRNYIYDYLITYEPDKLTSMNILHLIKNDTFGSI